MNKKELEKIKQKAIFEHIPIIMDDTLEVIEKEMKNNPPKRILEIGTACRIFSDVLFRISSRRWKNRYH